MGKEITRTSEKGIDTWNFNDKPDIPLFREGNRAGIRIGDEKSGVEIFAYRTKNGIIQLTTRPYGTAQGNTYTRSYLP